MSLNADERETTITSTDGGTVVTIWTSQRRHIGRLRRHPSYTETRSGYHDTTEWAEFTIPATEWNPATGAKRSRTMTDEQRTAAAERLAAARAARTTEEN